MCASILKEWRDRYESSGKTPVQEWQEMHEAGLLPPPPSPEFCTATYVFYVDGESDWAETIRKELFPRRIRFREFL